MACISLRYIPTIAEITFSCDSNFDETATMFATDAEIISALKPSMSNLRTYLSNPTIDNPISVEIFKLLNCAAKHELLTTINALNNTTWTKINYLINNATQETFNEDLKCKNLDICTGIATIQFVFYFQDKTDCHKENYTVGIILNIS